MAYTWTGTAYIDAHGDAVPDADIHAALGTIQAAASGQIAALSQRVANGDLRPTIWQRNVAGVIRDASLTAGALAAGGWDNLDEYEDDIADRLTTQFVALDGFREDLPQLSPVQIAARSLLYVGSVTTIFASVARTVATQQAGVQQVRNVLDPAALHCDDCPDLTAQGWVDPDEMDLPGERSCGGNCRCVLEYRTVSAEEAVA